MWPLAALTPDSWFSDKSSSTAELLAYLYYALVIAILVVVFGRLGRWPELLRRVFGGRPAPRGEEAPAETAPAPEADPAEWPELRAAGQGRSPGGSPPRCARAG